METYHIHITGIVQGVGFRPFVCRLAEKMKIRGRVSNTPDGVHIRFNAEKDSAGRFYDQIILHPPAGALITRHHIDVIGSEDFSTFNIEHSTGQGRADLLPAPDITTCNSCRQEIADAGNRRYRYAFTTCLECGPRYSILRSLPYDREHTTMSGLAMCPSCAAEYENIHDSRFYSQTNSCPDCAIPLHLYDNSGRLVSSDPAILLARVSVLLKAGAIVAVKGLGGYLLLCDATREDIVRRLRLRKSRPTKPFAVLYKDVEMAAADLLLTRQEKEALQDRSGPVVLARMKEKPLNENMGPWIAPGLDRIGALLPCTPLLLLIAEDFGRPLVATSANISGSPIVYNDKEALSALSGLADYIVIYDRDIVTPQDDSVLLFTDQGQRIVLRRSRGLAPNYFPNPFDSADRTLLGMGGELKSAFAFQDRDRLYISQYLGDQGSLEAQESFNVTLQHWMQLLKVTPDLILIDPHPGYAISRLGRQLAAEKGAPVQPVQHHRAHFAAVLAENQLLSEKDEPVLGFIWDGAGYGDDGQVWGGEIFLLAKIAGSDARNMQDVRSRQMVRVAYLDYFPQFPGDKMNREPRLAALSLLSGFQGGLGRLEGSFTTRELDFYSRWSERPDLLTSSMGRLLDGIAFLLGLTSYNTYEGEAVMQLESLAGKCRNPLPGFYPIPLVGDRLCWQFLLEEVLKDIDQGNERAAIARKVFYSLARMIEDIAATFAVRKLAFSGGVFQSRLLTALITGLLSDHYQLYFHRQLSPNDECIGFGQVAWANLNT